LSPASPSPPAAHTPPHSLAAAAALNAGMQNEDARRPSGSSSVRRDAERARRRSSIRMNLNLNDPGIPAPGELQMSPSTRAVPNSPRRERAPSLGELHQELEYEQEGQVNRLLNMIRQQQVQIDTLRSGQQGVGSSSSAIADDSTPTSERSLSFPQAALSPQQSAPQVPTNIAQPRSRSPYGVFPSMSRHSSIAELSRGSSRTGSPSIPPMSSGSLNEGSDWIPGPARDESVFYQAETQNLTRENQMLKLRIRELERHLAELNPSRDVTHSPVIASNLHTSPPVSRRETISEGNPST
jgi:hypothetical protein